jgi:hypothetical protein
VFSILDEATISEATAARENEVRRLLTEREARREERSVEPRRWRWRVEPGKEEAFEHLRGWLLRSQGDPLVETAATSRETAVRVPERAHKRSAEGARARCRSTGRRMRLVPSSVRLAGRGFSRVSRRLLQWDEGTRAR